MTHGIPRLAPLHDRCAVCSEPLPEGRRADRAYCSVRCRVSAYRHKAAVTPATARGATNLPGVAPIPTEAVS